MHSDGRRQSNLEALRVLSILLIIAFHCAFKGGFELSGAPAANRFLVDLLCHAGELGVNCFILISGYFLPESQFRWKKAVLLAAETEFYIVLSRAVLVWAGQEPWDKWDWRSYVFPILHPTVYWFATAYLLLYVLTPYLKKLALALTRREFAALLATQLVIWCVFPTAVLSLVYGNGDPETMYDYNRFIWLVVVYLLGAYLRLHGLPAFDTLKKSLLWLLGTALVLGAYILAAEHGLLPGADPIFFWPPNTVPELLLSVSLFMVFAHWRLPCIGWLNYAASCTLGIYLLHDGQLSRFLWRTVFRTAAHVGSPLLILHIGFAVAAIAAGGLAVDSLRKLLERGAVAAAERLLTKK